jgi:histidinol-phosphate/aromatic aminotransferase/cobyric acid decarboxylase-like protein
MSRELIRRTVSALDGYVPGEQPAPGTSVVKLNTNESPYPPSPRVIDAIRSVSPGVLRRYPRPMADEFRVVGALLIDEAYADFAEANCLKVAIRLPNVIVARTLSR